MKNKKGIILEINKNEAYVMLSNGAFTKLRIKGSTLPKVGEEYEGEEIIKSTSFFNKAALAASLTFILLSSTGVYAYFTPVSTVSVNSDSGVQLKVNRFNRVVSVTPLNEGGEKVIKELSVKNKNIDNALVEILDQAKKENYIKEDKNVDIEVKGNKLNVEKFKEKLQDSKLNLQINMNEKKQNTKDNKLPEKEDKNIKENTNVNSNKHKDNEKSNEKDNESNNSTKKTENNNKNNNGSKNNTNKSNNEKSKKDK